MNIGYMIVGCIFLFNPFINIIDILPDFIGYLFILKALSELSDLERNIGSARKKFKAAMWVSLVKCLLVFASMIFDSTWYLILTFTFGILECMYLIPGFIDLFYGISYLEGRYTNHKSRFEARTKYNGVFDKTEFESGTAYFEVFTDVGDEEVMPFAEENVFFADKQATVRLADAGFASKIKEKVTHFYESAEARTMSVIFVIVRAAAACLPELTAIAETGSGYVESNPIDDYSVLRELLIILLAVFALIVGIVWLVRMIRYFNIFRKDGEFISVLKEKYNREIMPNKALWVKRKSLSFCTVATAAYAFLMCLRIDWFLLVPKIVSGKFHVAVYDVLAFFPIPEFLFGAVMIFAAFAAKNFAENKREIIRKSVWFIISSFAAYIAVFFLSWHYGKLIYPYKESGYIALFATYFVLFALSMLAFQAISKEKRKVYLRLAREITDVSCPQAHAFSERKRTEMMDEFAKKIKRHYILETVYAAASAILTLGMPFSEDYDICGLFWFFRLLFGVVLIVHSLLLSDALQKEIEKIVE
ncbi:MAG: hypothetical protein IJ489_04425 [Clostridia bacterium]|nr:hypothetical protein [Clostridia bacterium]